MAIITSANAASAIVKLVAYDALPALLGNLVMGNLVNRDYEPILQKAGDTINVPIPPIMSAHLIAETGSVTLQNPSLGNAQIVLNTHYEATFEITDVVAALATPNLMLTYMKPAVIALATQIDTDLLSLYAQFTANTPVGVPGSAVTEAVIDQAEGTLFTALVPPNDQLNYVCDVNAYSQIRQIERFSEERMNGQLGADAINKGKIVEAKGLTVFRSQNVQKTGTSPVATHGIAFHKDAMGLVVRKLPLAANGMGVIQEYAEQSGFGLRVTMSYQPNQLAQQMSIDVLYGVGVLRNAFGLRVEN
jgi:coat protein Gp5